MTPERRQRLREMALEVLHRSCATTPAAEAIDPEPARAIALGYLELSLMPSAIWRNAAATSLAVLEGDEVPPVPGAVITDADEVNVR